MVIFKRSFDSNEANYMSEAPTVFYSWQSDSPGGINRWFIRDALKAAIDQLGIKGEQALRLDHDTKDEAGTPDIPYVVCLGSVPASSHAWGRFPHRAWGRFPHRQIPPAPTAASRFPLPIRIGEARLVSSISLPDDLPPGPPAPGWAGFPVGDDPGPGVGGGAAGLALRFRTRGPSVYLNSSRLAFGREMSPSSAAR